mmetsp:Transcript_36531/g.67560  ORF Transcript_36531/g.67560 Transcript_36531/m.67560 type:complete len:322 (+) Transcript_36531:431-1396(+)
MSDLVDESSPAPTSSAEASRSVRTLCSMAPLVLSRRLMTVSECCSLSSAIDASALRFSSDTAFLTAAVMAESSLVRMSSTSRFASTTRSNTDDATNLTSGWVRPCQVVLSTNAKFTIVEAAATDSFPPNATLRTSSMSASSSPMSLSLDLISLPNACRSELSDSSLCLLRLGDRSCSFLAIASSKSTPCSSILPRMMFSAKAASTSRWIHDSSSPFLSSLTASSPDAARMDATLCLFFCISASLFCFRRASAAFLFSTCACFAAASFTLFSSLCSFCRSLIIFTASFCAAFFSARLSADDSFSFFWSSALHLLSPAISSAS